ncbi:FixH family protein [Halothiobacillus sp. DCM-1]|uniref:FixH family protein n=1 Tax=Halothiobacillus sp. DCM-1 TaxID=3112558 RepID=UPI003252765A
MNLVLPAGVGIVAILVLFYLLKWRWPRAGRPIAVILGVLSLAAYAPYAITHWPGSDIVTAVVAIYVMTAFILGFIYPAKSAGGGKASFHWGPASIIIFLSVIVLLDSIFVTLASSGLSQRAAHDLLPKPDEGSIVTSFFPGTVARDYQQQEKLFNQYDDALDEQVQLGWKVHKGWVDEPVMNQPALFKVSVTDDHGQAVSGAQVSLDFMRPADKRLDFSVSLPELGDGAYQLPIKMTAPGLWEVMVHIQKGAANFELNGRTNVQMAPRQSAQSTP